MTSLEYLKEIAEWNQEEAVKYSAAGVDGCFQNIGNYLVHVEEKEKLLREYYESEQYDDYVIKIHALKGTLALIGCVNLSLRAKELEYAGRNQQYDRIHSKHSAFYDDFLELNKRLKCAYEMWRKEISDSLEQNENMLTIDERRILLERLIAAANDMDTSLIEVIGQEICDSILNEQEHYYMKEIRKQADDFEYEQVGKLAREYLDALGCVREDSL